ncbi:MAG: response regulator [Mucilaginibacter sp.]|nr:response regulator [Mucilaginibacter sp.]
MDDKPLETAYLIDDQDIDRQISSLLLKKINKRLTIYPIGSARAALEKLRLSSVQDPDLLPDFIFLDIDMPEMNGWEFLSAYQELDIGRYKPVKIFVLSGLFGKEDIPDAIPAHLVKAVISKPLSLDHIRDIFGHSR